MWEGYSKTTAANPSDAVKYHDHHITTQQCPTRQNNEKAGQSKYRSPGTQSDTKNMAINIAGFELGYGSYARPLEPALFSSCNSCPRHSKL